MMRPLMKIVLYGRSSYEASIHVPLPAYHHWRDAPLLFSATAFNPIPDDHASIIFGGSAAPPVADDDDRNDGRTYPAYRDSRPYATRSQRRTGQTQPFVEKYLHAVRDGPLSTSAVPRNRTADGVRARKPVLSAGSLRRYKRHN